MPNSKQIVYLSQAQYAELIANGSITVNGVTVTYNDNDIYVTPQAEPITDVKLAGTSIGSNGVANIPVATNSGTIGLVRANHAYGTQIGTNGLLYICPADYPGDYIPGGTDGYRPIVPKLQHRSVFYGLSKIAGIDLASISNITEGIYPDTSKAAIQNMLGITDLLSTEESSTATAAHAINSTFMMGGKLYKATAAIAVGDAVVEGTNCEVVKVEDVFVKNTDYATSNVAGVVMVNSTYGLKMLNGNIMISAATSQDIKGENGSKAISPSKQHEAVFYGLSKVAGVDLASETVTLGTYPETSKTAIRSLIGAAAVSDITVTDVQVNGTSVLNSGMANIPIANSSTYGVVKVENQGIALNSNNILQVVPASLNTVKSGIQNYNPVVPAHQHEAVFYGLTKAAGVDMASSENAVGTYTNAAKSAIRTMLGATSPDVIAVQDEQPTNADTKVWLPETEAQGIEVPTYAEFQALDAAVVKKTDIASSSTAGIVKVGNVLYVDANNKINVDIGSDAQYKAGAANSAVVALSNQHKAVFYGLAKAAGDSTQASSSNSIGVYTSDASAAIRSMLGAVGDVQVDGTSIVSNGIANIPIASTSTFGAVKCGTGLSMMTGNNAGKINTNPASTSACKNGAEYYAPITPNHQHEATFYGLAKAAGDATQSASSNAVGTYTDSAKASIKSMLGIIDGSTGTVDITGTTPSITAVENTRYVCGEVSTLSFTPVASGICIVRFTSGSTATVLTVPNTVKFPEWFDITALEADTIYEMCITDGIYGAVMSWAL